VQEGVDVERLSFHPRLHARRGEQVVELEGEFEALLCGEEGLQVEGADAGERRLLDFADEAGDVEIAPGSASMPSRARRPVAVEPRRSRKASGSSRTALPGAAKERMAATGRPLRLPGV
jgi:hypothetical protein